MSSRLLPALALFPLRLFLGITFVYAGVQKLSDPGFLHPGAPTYIGTQLEGFANGTPGGFILRTFAIPHPGVAGVGVAITEILIGLLVTVGLFTRIAAAGGMGLNFLLFLTASWNTTPYFLGPDLVFTFAWLPFVLAGASGQPALDSGARRDGVGDRRYLDPGERQLLPLPNPDRWSRVRRRGAGSGARAPKVPKGAVKLGPASRLPNGQAATYSDPASGEPAIVIRDSQGRLAAFSAVCTHAGCTVWFEGGVIVCPCHGGEYNAATGEVIAGPPPAPLAQKKVVEAGGQIYAVPS